MEVKIICCSSLKLSAPDAMKPCKVHKEKKSACRRQFLIEQWQRKREGEREREREKERKREREKVGTDPEIANKNNIRKSS
jgi:hypothetical protein